MNFFDSKNENIQKSVHHFQSTTMNKEEKWVQVCWLVCLDDKHSLTPAFKIYVDESEEDWNTLNFFKYKLHTATTSVTSHKIETVTHSTIAQENLDGTAINTPAKVNKETVNLHWEDENLKKHLSLQFLKKVNFMREKTVCYLSKNMTKF